MRSVVFRADASTTIGFGHVIRCLTLATTLRKRGAMVSFVCRVHDGHLCDLIEEQGFAVKRLALRQVAASADDTSPYVGWLGASWQEDAEQTRDFIEALAVRPDWLVVDHYGIDARWERALRTSLGHGGIMVIDDLADRIHDCDVLLDQNLVARMHTRYAEKVPAACRLLLGPAYALLQSIYAELRNRVPPREGPIKRILVFFGGADSNNLTGRTLNVLLGMNRPDIEVDVVVASSSRHAAAIRQLVTGHDNMQIHSGLPTLAPLMAKADLAVGGGGATSWERLCLGLPSVVITLEENQRAIAAELGDRGLVRWLGHQDTVDESIILQALSELMQRDMDQDWSIDCRAVVDGTGVDRVCTALIVTAHTPFRARNATLEDESLFQIWINESMVRRNALSAAPSSVATHRVWFHNCLRNVDEGYLYIIETYDGVSLGLIQFERSGQHWEGQYVLSSMVCECDLARPLLSIALVRLRADEDGPLTFGRASINEVCAQPILESLYPDPPPNDALKRWEINICSGADSWINASIPDLLLDWLVQGHWVTWGHDATTLPVSDICFYLSYGRIVDANTRMRHKNNLVVHASALPKGRGWSPLTWQILEGKDGIPVTLFEAADAVDSGSIYKQVQLPFTGLELIDELRAAVARATLELCAYFVVHYPEIAGQGVRQDGEPTFYPRRRAKDSQLDVDQSLRAQFNLLRTVDAESYPAWFEIQGKRFVLKIERFGETGMLKKTL